MKNITMANNGHRIDYLDSLRAFIIIIVVLHHALLAYSTAASPSWYVANPETTIFVDGVILINDIFMMPAMFFIAGFFVLLSMRHGIASFLKKKILRILLPLLGGVFLLVSPFISYLGHMARGDYTLDFFSYYFSVYLPQEVEPHHLWFLSFLFLLFLLCVPLFIIRQKLSGKPAGEKTRGESGSPVFFLAFGFVTALLYFSATVFINDGYWFGIGGFFAFQVTRAVFYVSYFFLGAAAYKRDWLAGNRIYRHGRLYVFTAVFLTMLIIIFRALAPNPGDIVVKLINALLHSYVCLAWLLSLLFIFHKAGEAGRRLPGFLVTNSYRIYVIHAVPVIAAQLLLVELDAPLYIKAAAVFSAGLGISLLLSILIQRVQVLVAPVIRGGTNHG